MRDQDVILVEAYNKQVNVSSGLKTNGLYELKENETVEDVLNFAGGFSSIRINTNCLLVELILILDL